MRVPLAQRSAKGRTALSGNFPRLSMVMVFSPFETHLAFSKKY
jgi:hypothetical protein